MSKFFGSKQETAREAPTGFQTLPGFAQGAAQQNIQFGQNLLNDPSILEGVPISQDQQELLDIIRLNTQPLTSGRFQEQLDVFQNPQIENVLGPSLEDLRLAGQSVLGDIGSQASGAGAFGSARQGIAEATLGQNLAREAGRLSGDIRSRAFESASQKALGQITGQASTASHLFQLEDLKRQIEQQTQLAPVQASELLSTLVARLPTGGGNVTETTRGRASVASGLGSLSSTAGAVKGLF